MKWFIYDVAVLPLGNLLFEEGALPMLEDLDVIYRVSMVNADGFCLGIEHLPKLKHAQVRLYKVVTTFSKVTCA